MPHTTLEAPPKPSNRRRAPTELLQQAETADGYTVLTFARYKGRRRVYWWHCGGCWEEGEPVRDLEDSRQDSAWHLRILCPAYAYSAVLTVTRNA